MPATNVYALRARYVFPVAGRPIAGGCVTIAGERIVEVGRSTSASEIRDLGDVAILPGLVNAHTHLEFSDLPAPLGRPGMVFAEWIAQVTASRGRTATTFAASDSVTAGLHESLAAGVTSIGEIAVAGWSVSSFTAAPADVVVFRELICLAAERIPDMLEVAREHLRQPRGTRVLSGLSPHAPYTVHPDLFARSIDLAAVRAAPIAFHLAESPDELELLRSGTGPFYDYLSARGFWVPEAIPPGTRPIDYLRVMARCPRSLVVHGNYLDDVEQAFVAQNRDRMSVIYCPRTHAYFGHPRHPLEQLLSRGAHVALGTDGRVSNPDLDLLAEMRYVARKYPALSGSEVLRLGTLAGAEALGIDSETGSLVPGKCANLAVFPLSSRNASDPHELVLDSDAPCRLTFSRGALVYQSQRE